jgi:hypothetical protein
MRLPVSGVHECSLTQTNSGSFVYLCTCGDIGLVHRCTPRSPSSVATARGEAEDEWSHHYKVVHARMVPLNLEASREILTHRGRFGRS